MSVCCSDGELGWGVLNPLENLMKSGALLSEICARACTPTSPVEFHRVHGPLDSVHLSYTYVVLYLGALCIQDSKNKQE